MTGDAPNVALVADDHELPRVALSALLRTQLGFAEVLEAASLEEASDQLGRSDGVALALIDLNMPGVDGAESLHAVRIAYPTVKLVIVSASTRREDMLIALSAGAHGYVPKLTRMDDMAAALRDVLSGKIFVPPSIADVGPSAVGGTASRAGGHVELTARQRDVLKLVRSGLSNKQIARELNLGLGTVKVHLAGLFRALGVSSRAAAITAADGARQDD